MIIQTNQLPKDLRVRGKEARHQMSEKYLEFAFQTIEPSAGFHTQQKIDNTFFHTSVCQRFVLNTKLFFSPLFSAETLNFKGLK